MIQKRCIVLSKEFLFPNARNMLLKLCKFEGKTKPKRIKNLVAWHLLIIVNTCPHLILISSNINEVIRAVLIFFFVVVVFFFFFVYMISQVPKSTKKHQKAPKRIKKHLSGKK